MLTEKVVTSAAESTRTNVVRVTAKQVILNDISSAIKNALIGFGIFNYMLIAATFLMSSGVYVFIVPLIMIIPAEFLLKVAIFAGAMLPAFMISLIVVTAIENLYGIWHRYYSSVKMRVHLNYL